MKNIIDCAHKHTHNEVVMKEAPQKIVIWMEPRIVSAAKEHCIADHTTLDLLAGALLEKHLIKHGHLKPKSKNEKAN